MACYNAGRFIEDAIRSILEQTHWELELIIADDGSTDDSVQKINSFNDPRIRLISIPHSGAAKARNAAFRNSTAKYVLFMDADDLVSPTHLGSLLNAIESAEGCIGLSQWARFLLNPEDAIFPTRHTEQDLPGADWLELDWQSAKPMTQSGMLLIPRQLIVTHGLWDERLTLHDDFELFARLISRSRGIRFAKDAKLYYRSAVTGSLSGQRTRKAAESAFLSVKLGTDHLLSVKDTPRTRLICANMLKTFEYSFFPAHTDLIKMVRSRIDELGGSDLEPDGPPRFHQLRRVVGWKAARRIQNLRDKVVF